MATKRKKKKSKGLGDTIEKFTEATGIKKVVKWIAGEDCGCDKRKEKLNQMFKYKSDPQCLTEPEYNYLKDFFKVAKQSLKQEEQREILKISNRVFNEKREVSSCGSCVRELIKQMERLYDIYKEEHDK
tara:strand:- start:2639 stop:3025 length:387 start_codon:yes stop_codon:yes gene_type:complete